MKKIVPLVLVATLGVLSSSATTLSGLVEDIGKESTTDRGISGVKVEVLDEAEKIVGLGLTNSEGRYEILNLPLKTLEVKYTRAGYVDRPTERMVEMDADGEEVGVRMMLDPAFHRNAAYFERVQRYLLLTEEESPGLIEEESPELIEELKVAAMLMRTSGEFPIVPIEDMTSDDTIVQNSPRAATGESCREMNLDGADQLNAPGAPLEGLSDFQVDEFIRECRELGMGT